MLEQPELFLVGTVFPGSEEQGPRQGPGVAKTFGGFSVGSP